MGQRKPKASEKPKTNEKPDTPFSQNQGNRTLSRNSIDTNGNPRISRTPTTKPTETLESPELQQQNPRIFKMPMSAFLALRGRRKRSVSRPSSSSPSSTTTSSSSLTKTVCIRAISEEGQSNWFLVNVSFKVEEEESKRKSQARKDPYDELVIRFFGRRHHHRPGVTEGNFPTLDEEIHPFSNAKLSSCSSWASIGATLYCVGGVLPRREGRSESDYSRVVRAYDLSPSPTHHGWTKNLSPMIRRRHTPYLAVLDDKLYAFGGVSEGSLFAEVYDPIVDKWEALPPPSPTIRDNASFAAPLQGMKKIAVGFKSLYNVVTESWEIVEGLDGFTGEAPVTVGNTIYWFWPSKLRGSCIRAYDFDQMKLFEGVIKSFEHETLFWNAKTYLLHMGGDTFCLLWYSPIPQTKTQYHCTQLHVFKEEVSEEGSSGVLNARVLACQSFITPGEASICEAQTVGISLIEDNRQDEAIGDEDSSDHTSLS